MTLKDEIIELSKPFEVRIRSAISSGAPKDERCGSLSRYFGDIVAETSLHSYKGCIYWFNGKIYSEISEKDFRLALFDSMEEFGVSDADINGRGHILLSKSMRESSRKELHPSKRMLSFLNGVLDLDSGKLSPPSRKLHVLSMVGYKFEPDAKCPRWIKFLEQVLPELESRMVLQEYLGLIFIDRHKTSLEEMLILLGGGSNGKSVVFQTIKGILGEANISFTPIEDLVGGKSAENMASIDGKLLNYNSELGKKELNGKKVKALISGEETPARQLYKDSYVAKDIPLMMANANALPDTTDDSQGFFRRFKVLTFGVTIREQDRDKNLSSKLQDEYSGIFNWIIEGRTRMINNDFKFTESANAKQSSHEYETSSNSALLFLKEYRYFGTERFSGHASSRMLQRDIYKAYCDYCSVNNYKAFSSKSFREKLASRGYKHTPSSAGNYFTIFCAPDESLIKVICLGEQTKMGELELAKYCGYDGYAVGSFEEEDSEETSEEVEIQKEIKFEGDECP